MLKVFPRECTISAGKEFHELYVSRRMPFRTFSVYWKEFSYFEEACLWFRLERSEGPIMQPINPLEIFLRFSGGPRNRADAFRTTNRRNFWSPKIFATLKYTSRLFWGNWLKTFYTKSVFSICFPLPISSFGRQCLWVSLMLLGTFGSGFLMKIRTSG